jgi:N-acetylneuraminic acid mutarotase
MIVYGGFIKSPTTGNLIGTNEIWSYTLNRNAWKKLSASGTPPSATGMSMVYAYSQLYVFGGVPINGNQATSNVVVSCPLCRTVQWSVLKVRSDPPPVRINAGATTIKIDDIIYLIVTGGKAGEGGASYDDTWKLNLQNLEWTELTESRLPVTVASHSLTSASAKIFSFGGLVDNGGRLSRDFLGLDIAAENPTWRVLRNTGPLNRYQHSLTTMDDTIYIFGGRGDRSTIYGDSWSCSVKSIDFNNSANAIDDHGKAQTNTLFLFL